MRGEIFESPQETGGGAVIEEHDGDGVEICMKIYRGRDKRLE